MLGLGSAVLLSQPLFCHATTEAVSCVALGTLMPGRALLVALGPMPGAKPAAHWLAAGTGSPNIG